MIQSHRHKRFKYRPESVKLHAKNWEVIMQRHLLFVLTLVTLVLVACSSSGEGATTVQEVPVTVEVTREVEIEVTRLVEVEVTREVEVVLQPTSTPEPTPTTEPAEEPIRLSGSGDAIVNVEKWDGAAAVHITATGEGDFRVDGYDVDGESRNLIWDDAPFDGIVELDFGSATTTTRFSVEAPGDWTIEVMPMSMLPVLEVPGKFEGSGYSIIALTGETPDLATITGDDSGYYLSITGYGYGSEGRLFFSDNPIVVSTDELPYAGTAVISADTAFLVIAFDGNWSIEITAR